MSITRELVRSVRQRVADNPGVLTAQLAAEFNASEADVITALPLDMRLRAKTDDFEAIWSCLASWGRMEINPARLADHDLGNHSSGTPVDYLPGMFLESISSPNQPARFNREELGFIWFISKPLFREESHSVQFFSKRGEHMLSIYVGRDAAGKLDEKAAADYRAMRDRFGVIPVPKRRQCQGCGRCSCGGKKHVH